MNYLLIQEIFDLIPLAFSYWIIVLLLTTTNLIYSGINKLFNKDKYRRITYERKLNRQKEIKNNKIHIISIK